MIAPGGGIHGFLERFRGRGATPRAGADPSRELAGVFAKLDAIGAEADAIERDARLLADRIGREGQEDVRDLLAQGRAEAEAEHARIVATARRRAEHRAEQTLDAARTRAAEILRTGEERMPGLVDEVLACLREDLS